MPQSPVVFKMAGVFMFMPGARKKDSSSIKIRKSYTWGPGFRGAEYKKVKPKIYKISGNQTEVCIIPLL